jgi:hypothetical protein
MSTWVAIVAGLLALLVMCVWVLFLGHPTKKKKKDILVPSNNTIRLPANVQAQQAVRAMLVVSRRIAVAQAAVEDELEITTEFKNTVSMYDANSDIEALATLFQQLRDARAKRVREIERATQALEQQLKQEEEAVVVEGVTT